MDNNRQKIFSIHFPEKKVYIENTSGLLYDRMNTIRNDMDHLLYRMLKEYPFPEIKVESYWDDKYDKKLIASKYKKENYEILNFIKS